MQRAEIAAGIEQIVRTAESFSFDVQLVKFERWPRSKIYGHTRFVVATIRSIGRKESSKVPGIRMGRGDDKHSRGLQIDARSCPAKIIIFAIKSHHPCITDPYKPGSQLFISLIENSLLCGTIRPRRHSIAGDKLRAVHRLAKCIDPRSIQPKLQSVMHRKFFVGPCRNLPMGFDCHSQRQQDYQGTKRRMQHRDNPDSERQQGFASGELTTKRSIVVQATVEDILAGVHRGISS